MNTHLTLMEVGELLVCAGVMSAREPPTSILRMVAMCPGGAGIHNIAFPPDRSPSRVNEAIVPRAVAEALVERELHRQTVAKLREAEAVAREPGVIRATTVMKAGGRLHRGDPVMLAGSDASTVVRAESVFGQPQKPIVGVVLTEPDAQGRVTIGLNQDALYKR